MGMSEHGSSTVPKGERVADQGKMNLLRRFEPVLKFTQGERFFPMNTVDYVAEASLWEKAPEKPPHELLPEEELDIQRLGQVDLSGVHNTHYLQFISPLNIRELAEFRINLLREAVKNRTFRPTRSRLARVGYLARIVDAVFSISLLLRGRVPGDSMAAAVVTYKRKLDEKRAFHYYGRVVEQAGWVILQYWYFYPYNNWRTGFFGGNDHEADWEMVNVYCYRDSAGEIQPAWTAYACHDFSGADLRRHWDDPELEKVGEHPVVYVGGGSHASYFQTGEYLTQISLPFLKPVRNFFSGFEKFFNQLFKEKNMIGRHDTGHSQAFSVPFVDYALGDGVCIGPGCEDVWAEPVLIDPMPAWVANYRGLWGYFAQDPFSGEDAPAGPRYNRDGTIRQAWFDPLGWAGMENVMPPTQQLSMLRGRQTEIRDDIQTLEEEILRDQDLIYRKSLDLAAVEGAKHLRDESQNIQSDLEEQLKKLREKRRKLTVLQSKLNRFDNLEAELAEGIRPSLRSHIQHAHHPQSKKTLRLSWLAEIWAAVSIGIMMITVVLLILFAKQFLLVGLGGLLLVMVAIEAAFKRRLSSLVRWIAILLALGAFVILLYEFFWYFVLTVVMVTGFYMIIENLRELSARRK